MEISVARIEEETNYWFVRTQQGDYYEDFFLNNFIGINWDKIESFDPDAEKTPIVEKIKELYPDEAHPGHTYNQLRRFMYEIKPGDIVLIPSKRTTHITFGIVQSTLYIDQISEEAIIEGACPFQKRRKVSWFKTIPRDRLDPYLYMLFYSQHTITNANEYAPYIDRTLHSLYVRGERAHLVLRVTTEQSVHARDLLKILDGSLDLVDIFNDYNEERVDTNEYEIKINVQSPGPVEIIAGASAIFVLCVVLHYIIGGKFDSKFSLKEIVFSGETEGLIEKILKFKERAKEDPSVQKKINEVRESMDKLEVKVPEAIDSPKVKEEDEIATTKEQ